MRKSDFFYDLPQELIAQTPIYPRDISRLLYYDRKSNGVKHLLFRDIKDILNSNDVLVINNTKVLYARFFGYDKKNRKFEVLLLKRLGLKKWEALLKPARKAKIGSLIAINEDLKFKVSDIIDNGVRILDFEYQGVFEEILVDVGEVPLPPYITKKLSDKERYNTVYAKVEGSSAAPTAGLHFTPELLDELKQKGVEVVEILLHVGLGTFRPVQEENIQDHKMHKEYYEISEDAAKRINQALEQTKNHCCRHDCKGFGKRCRQERTGESCSGETDIFIYPPYNFKVVKGLITNFHLPESTLIMPVSAFLSRESFGTYKLAIEENYRFFSFGDAMLIL